MASKIKQADGYQVKQVLADKAAELNAFGWNKVKNSTRVIKKKQYVDVRRKLGLARIPGLKPIENKYNKWSKKKIKKNPVGGIFACLFMVIFFAVAIVGLYIGLTDNILSGNAYEKSIAVYNAAVKTGVITASDVGVDSLDACTVDGEMVTETDGYKAFVKKYVAYSFGGFVNTNDFSETQINDLGDEYLDQLVDLGYAEDSDKALAYDKTISSTDSGYAAGAALVAPIDNIVDGMVRPILQGFGLGYKGLVAGFGIPLIAGAACFVLFIICLIAFISICNAKKRIAKRDEIVAECVKEGSELVYGVKVKNRDLMTKTERKMHDMQSMIVRAIHQANDEDDDE